MVRMYQTRTVAEAFFFFHWRIAKDGILVLGPTIIKIRPVAII